MRTMAGPQPRGAASGSLERAIAHRMRLDSACGFHIPHGADPLSAPFGPLGSTPFHRPMYWGYVLGETEATSIEDYLDNYQVHGQLAAPKRLYAGLVSNAPTRGISGYMNQFAPRVEPWSFSIMEFAVACPAPNVGPAQELIGVVISVDKANGFGPNMYLHQDGKARLHVEFSRLQNGKLEFVWDMNKPGLSE